MVLTFACLIFLGGFLADLVDEAYTGLVGTALEDFGYDIGGELGKSIMAGVSSSISAILGLVIPYIYYYFGWKKPVFHHYGLVNIPDTVLKTSLIKQSIKNGEYRGWDDVRTGTVRALKRRGITPEAIRR